MTLGAGAGGFKREKKISLWLSSSVAGKDEEGKGRGGGGNAGILTSPTTGEEQRRIAEREEAVKSISVFGQATLQTLDSSSRQSVMNLHD